MSAQNIKNLLFSYVPDAKLIKEAIGWDLADRFSEEPVTARFLSKKATQQRTLKYSEEQHRIVELIFLMLGSLSDETLDGRAKSISDINHTYKMGEFPTNLDTQEVEILAKNAQWMRYDACLLSLGFVLCPSSRSVFFDCVYSKGNIKSELLSLPLFKEFFILDRQLANSGVFKVEKGYGYTSKAPSPSITKWLRKMELPMPEGLQSRVDHFFGPEINKTSALGMINPKERSSMLILINAMAKAKFRFKPNESLGPPKAAIDLAVRDLGLTISDRTIGEYLKASEKEAERQRDKTQ